MPKYVSLINWTEQGVKNFKDTTARAKDATALAQKMGGKLTVYWTLGAHDIVTLSEFPDDESATAFLLKVGALGNIRTQTLRAFDASEMAAVVAKAG